MDDKKRTNIETNSNVILENKEKLQISGVLDVEKFDEAVITLETTLGMLTVRGSNLHIEKLNLENGELSVIGKVEYMEYEDRMSAKAGFFAKLFG